MYNREIDEETFFARQQAHEEQNITNARRRKAGKPPIDSFPKQEFKLPNDLLKMRNLKTFIAADEFERVKKMKVHDLLQYLFRNMLIYECNLIFNNNFALKYNYSTVRISKKDYQRIFYSTVDKIPSEVYLQDNYLYFRFNLHNLMSFNKYYCGQEKARQYVLFNFSFVYSALRQKLGPKSKDFILLVLSLYKHSDNPKIQHSLPKLLQACNFTIHSKQKTIDRISKYFQYLQEWEILDDLKYTFTVDDLCCGRSLNIRLKPVDIYYT